MRACLRSAFTLLIAFLPLQAAPVPPLRTSGRMIVDAGNHRVKLAAVNWYGAEEQDCVVAGLEYAALPDIARQIRILGFNAVRLPWSNEMYESNPVISADRLAANSSLQGKRALDIFDAVIAALASERLLVVLDNHTSNADWCCSNTDGNGLWYNGQFPESSWIADWQGMARRYLNQPAVIGADLRNEPRAGATWGGADARYDWRGASRTLGAEESYGVLNRAWSRSASPDLLNALQAVTAPTAAPVFHHGGVVNPATFAAGRPIVPGSLATVFGSDLAPVTSNPDSFPLPAALGGVNLSVGDSIAVPLPYASPTQVTFQVPWELDPASPASLTASVGWLSSAGEPILLAAAAPVIFLVQPGVSDQGAILIANTTLLAMRPTDALPDARPARAGDFLAIFCTGLGAVSNQPATGTPAPSQPLASTIALPAVTIGSTPGEVAFSGLVPGFAGLYQVNVQVDPGTPSGDAVPVSLSISGADSNVVTIAIE